MTIEEANALINALIAAATIGTLVWAIRTTVTEGRRSREERAERLAFDERAQASRVVAWERQWLDRDVSEPTERRKLYVHNASEAAIFDVTVYFDVREDLLLGDPPSDGFRWWHAVLPAGQSPRELAHEPLEFCTKFGEDEALRVTFCDGAGRYWERDTTGALRRRVDLDGLTDEQRREDRYNEHLREMEALGLS